MEKRINIIFKIFVIIVGCVISGSLIGILITSIKSIPKPSISYQYQYENNGKTVKKIYHNTNFNDIPNGKNTWEHVTYMLYD